MMFSLSLAWMFTIYSGYLLNIGYSLPLLMRGKLFEMCPEKTAVEYF